MENWVEIRKAGNFVELAKEYGVSPVIARILRNRDLVNKEEVLEYLSEDSDNLHDPFLLSGMDRVIFVLKNKIEAGAKIRIIGDYDVDGISATFVLYKGLKFFGALADYVIPHRIEDGYGINERLIKNAADDGIDTIITCDNGIAAYNQTEYAKSLGLTMLITDHHEVPFEETDGVKKYIVPKAEAIVDPKLPNEKYPFSGICGAFVALKVIEAYAKQYGSYDGPSYELLHKELTEFAGLATVCDVMELKDENRTLVKRSLKLLADSSNLGMRSLIKVTGIEGKVLSPFHLGFVIGPCMNASGRLDTSLRALELFLCEDKETALKKAEELKDLNEERKTMTLEQTEEAFKIVDAMEQIDSVLVIYLENCHESLAGIIAGRVREKYVRPTFVVTKTDKGLKGSGRSIDAYNMYEGLNRVKDLLTKFGGHKLAAGISLDPENLDEFRRRLNEEAGLTDADFKETVRIDMELPFEYGTMDLCKELRALEPFGVGNERPLFAKRSVKFLSGRVLGKNGNAAKYKVLTDSNKIIELIYFGNLSDFENYVAGIYGEEYGRLLHKERPLNITLDICYRLDINTFRNVDSVQYQLVYYR